jgi:hypothetical protein
MPPIDGLRGLEYVHLFVSHLLLTVLVPKSNEYFSDFLVIFWSSCLFWKYHVTSVQLYSHTDGHKSPSPLIVMVLTLSTVLVV